MSFSKVTTILLSGVTVVWGLVSVQAANPAFVAQNPVVSGSAVPSQSLTSPTLMPSAVVSSSNLIISPSATAKPVAALITPTLKPASTPVANITPKSQATSSPVVTTLPTSTPVPTATPTPKSVVSYQVESSPSVYITDEIEVTNPVSVGELTKQIASKKNITFLYDVTDQGWFVTELAGVKNNPRAGFYWFYYVNGALGNTSVDQYVLKPGDKLRWQYDHTL